MRGRPRCAGSIGVALSLLPALAHAQGLNLIPRREFVLANLVVLLLLIWPVNRLLIAPLMRVLLEREARTRGSADQTGGLIADAEAARERLEARRKQARREAAERRSEINNRIKAEEQQRLDAARAEAAESLAAVRNSIAAEAEQARATLRSDARALAQLAAERILGRPL